LGTVDAPRPDGGARSGSELTTPERAGRNAVVVCLHASASSSRQWRPLAERLAGRFRVVAPDLYGSGERPMWTGDRPLGLGDEVAGLEPVLRAGPEPFHLVGHSYGAAVALHAALADPGRVRSLVIFEPVLFGLLLAEDPDQPAAREIVAVRDDCLAAVQQGTPDAAAERFIEYWMGPGAWTATPVARRAMSAQAMPAVMAQFQAIFAARGLSAYSAFPVPTLLLTGTASPASARGVVRLLSKALPDVTTAELDHLGHMAPVTHPDDVNAIIDQHLARFDGP
jgi:pimeloyl-ACP methyl ester carboxylesterase